MLAKTHMASGTAAWLAIAPAVAHVAPMTWAGLAVGTAVATWSALAPDIDHHGSTASRALLGPLRRPLHATLLAPLQHRGPTHQLLWQVVAAGLAWGALSLWAPSWAWLAVPFLVGLAVHSLGDCCTTGGVRFLWPMGLVMRLPIKTGGAVEKYVIAPLLTLTTVWLAVRAIDALL